MPASDFGTEAKSKRPKSIAPISHSGNQHTVDVLQTSLPVPIKSAKRSSSNNSPGATGKEKRWTR